MREFTAGVLQQKATREQVDEREEIQEQDGGDDSEGPAVVLQDQPGVQAEESELFEQEHDGDEQDDEGDEGAA